MTPLRREWDATRAKADRQWEKLRGDRPAGKRKAGVFAKPSKAVRDHEKTLRDFVERLAHVTILDPACGSGNFLYVAINLLLDLEKEVIAYAATHGVSLLPQVRPTQLAGIEINPYAQQLAQVVIWIGYLQWMHHNGFSPPRNPVLEPIESIQLMDAILDLSDPEHPKEPEWPKADFIVGNPPFLGGKLLRSNLGDSYVDAVFELWDGRVSRESDLCCYWFEKACNAIEAKRVGRVGLLATQAIRGGANRRVLDHIKAAGDIYFAISDREWVLDGAAVHVSLIGFDNGHESIRCLDGSVVNHINPNLRTNTDVTVARKLATNVEISYMGDTKGGLFDITEPAALQMLLSPNPHGQPNSDVVIPWINGFDLTQRSRGMWIIDFGVTRTLDDAARFETPFKHVDQHVRPNRQANKRESYREKWWIHVEARPALRHSLKPLERFVVTTRVSKHRLFAWFQAPTLPDSATFAFARSGDSFFGLLSSSLHELWARAQGTQLREVESGFRYTPSTCFETFPFPEPTAAQEREIAEAAKELDALRSRWLNPPEWTREEVLEFPGSLTGPWARYVQNADARGIGTVRYPRLAPRDEACAKQLAKRTLTNLYNERPTWLDLAHRRLDEAVFATYGWPADLSDDDLLARLLELNLARASAQG